MFFVLCSLSLYEFMQQKTTNLPLFFSSSLKNESSFTKRNVADTLNNSSLISNEEKVDR